MAFHDVSYDAYCVLGDPGAPPLWNRPVWGRFLEEFGPLAGAARGKSAVYSVQYRPDGGAVKFGRIGWGESGHRKWTHDPATTPWRFLDVEVWAPGRAVCGREGRPPDVFLSVVNEALFGAAGRALSFNPTVVLAVASDLAGREPTAVAASVGCLRRLTSARFVGFQRRQWGVSHGGVAFTNAIQDLAAGGLFRPGPRQGNGAAFPPLVGAWEPVFQGEVRGDPSFENENKS